MKNAGRSTSFVKTVLRATPLLLKATPWHCTTNILTGVVMALTFSLTVVATQGLFDAITLAAAGQGSFIDCLIPLLVLAGFTFTNQIVNGIINFQAGVLFEKSAGKIRNLLHRKLGKIDPALFEDTSFLDDLNKAREGAITLPMFVMSIFVLVSFYIMYFISIGAYLFSLKPILPVAIILSFFPALLSQLVRGKVFTKLEEMSAPLRREHEYYQRTLCDREYFKETRLLGAFHFFHALFSDTLRLLTEKKWHAERKTALLELLLSITSFAGMAISAYLLFTATMSGEITVGAFAAVFAALNQLFSIMEEIVVRHIGSMNQDVGKVANFVRMLNLDALSGDVGMPDFSKGVVANNVGFTYPGRETPAVCGVSLTINKGEILAIVGENGAGKSTMVRLLTGIYRPSSGNVTVGGLDTNSTAPSSVFLRTSGVLQKYQRYKMSLRENIAISDTATKADDSRIISSLKEAEAPLNIDLQTMLSPEFDGIDLSGGQWQRVAIARGLYKKNDFIVLDEPTSAIDPIEETRIYRQFQHLAEGKCAVLVTHRLGSAKLAHRIAVMDGGKLVDIGTHDALMSRAGKYKDMWAAQTKWYERPEIIEDGFTR